MQAYRGLGAIVVAWTLAVITAGLAVDRLVGTTSLVVVGAAMAGAMFFNDCVDLDPMFPSMKRVWIGTGLVRGVTGLVGIAAAIVTVLETIKRWDPTMTAWIFAGIVLGGIAGAAARTYREIRSRSKKREPE